MSEKMLSFLVVLMCVSVAAAAWTPDAGKVNYNITLRPSKNCTSWQNVTQPDVSGYAMTVCRAGESKTLIKPLSFLSLHDIRVHYNFLTNKFYITLNIQLTSSRILNKISKISEVSDTNISYMEVIKVKFIVRSPDVFTMPADIKLIEEWQQIHNDEYKDTFAQLKFETNSRDTAMQFIKNLTTYDDSKPGEAIEETIEMHLKVSDGHDYSYIKMRIKTTNVLPQREDIRLDIDFTNGTYPILLTKSGIPTIHKVQSKNDWILMQRRETPGLDFNKNWQAYKHGFGDSLSDFWLGLQKIYELTKDGGYGLRIEFESHKGLQRSGEWKTFRIGSERESYKLYLDGFNRSFSLDDMDCMSDLDGYGFATVDKDDSVSCASKFGGGYWTRPDFGGDCARTHFNSDLRDSYAYSETCVHVVYFPGAKAIYECLKRVRMFIIKH